MRALVFFAALTVACSSPEGGGPAPASSDAGADGAAEDDAAPSRCASDRSMADRPDDVDGYQIRVVYALPSDGVDEQLDLDGRIETSVTAWNGWLASQSGGPKMRLDTCDGKLDIGFIRLSRTDADIAAGGAYVREAIEKELRPAPPKKLLAVYYGGSSTYSCGGGAYPPELVGHVAAMYLKGAPPGAPTCDTNEVGASPTKPGYIDFAMLHEIFHSLGAAASCAPHHHLRGHVNEDPTDLMWSGDKPWSPALLDTGRDDYWGHGRADCVDVAKSVFVDPLPDDAVEPPGW